MLLKNERFNVSQINFVTNYNPENKKVYKFPGKLPTYELMYFYKGNVRLEFHNKNFFVKTGDVVFLPKGLENNRYRIISDHRFGLYNVYFDTVDLLPREAMRIPFQNENLKVLYEAIYRVWSDKKQGYYLKTMQLFYQLLQSIQKHQSNYARHKYNDCFVLVDEYMMEHFCDKYFNYEQLAQCSGFCYSYFKKVFISKYGLPPIKYITKLKINFACELLSSGKYKISEVAQQCGYENLYYFSNVFKKYIGVSPKNYTVTAKETAVN